MTTGEGQRKLTAIMAADVAGYSRLMADDERATVRTLTEYREVFSELVEAHQGRIVDTAGDSVLATFESVVEAVEAAVEVQRALAERNEQLPDQRRMIFRIGINLGDIIVRHDGTVYGDGVNVAARLEGLAEPGGIMIGDFARQAVEGKLDVSLADAGDHEVKNMAKPVRAYRVLVDGSEGDARAKPGKSALASRHRTKIMASLVAGLAVLVGLAVWGITIRVEAPQMVKADGTPTDDPMLAMPTGPSIAVLPFDNLGNDPEQDYFAIGLSEDIVSALSRFGDLRVIEGDANGGDYALEGSVRRDGDTLRVTAQLKDLRDGTQMWSEQFDRDLNAGAVFDIQDTITVAVATAIAGYNGAIARQRLGEATGARTEDLAAYDCVLLVYVKHDAAFSQETFNEARDCLEAAVTRDSDYVDALAALSYLYGDAYSMGWARELEGIDPIDRAFVLASHAVELNPRSTAAQRALALAYFYHHEIGDFAEHAERALALNPHDPQTLGQLGSYMAMMGEYERGAALVHKAYALNPALPDWYNLSLAMERYMAGDAQAALNYANKTKDPNNYIAAYMRIVYMAEVGRLDESGPERERLEALYPGYSIATMREEGAYWNNTPDLLDRVAASMRKAGFPEAPPEPARPVIAVLPFDNLSGDPEQEYFADGITEDIITRLAQYPDILVLGRNTTFQFKDQAVDIPTIAERLGADYVVEGSIRRGGDMVRVTAQLLGGDEWGHIWAETYDRTLDPENLFAIQDEITEAVASRIGDPYGAIGRAEVQRSSRQPPKSLSSYECILKYFAHLRNFNPETHRVARDCLEEVVEAESGYGEALAFLGNTYIAEVAFGFNASANSSLQRALDIIERGLAIDPESGRVRVLLARALYLTDNPARAIREAEDALQLDPNNVEVLAWAGAVFANTGAYDRAEEIMDKVALLNPNYPVWMNWILAKAHMARREYSDAITRLQMTQMEWWYWTKADIAACYCASGDIERGREELDAALQANPNLAEVFWKENYFWNKGPDVRPFIDATANGLKACGWEVPPDPGREAFALKN